MEAVSIVVFLFFESFYVLSGCLGRNAVALLRQLITVSPLHNVVKVEVIPKLTPTINLDHVSELVDPEAINVDLEHGGKLADPHELLGILFAMSVM